jgi:hypothetical protein
MYIRPDGIIVKKKVQVHIRTESSGCSPDALCVLPITFLLSSNENELPALFPRWQVKVPRCRWQFFKGTRIIKRASVNENTEVLPGVPED